MQRMPPTSNPASSGGNQTLNTPDSQGLSGQFPTLQKQTANPDQGGTGGPSYGMGGPGDLQYYKLADGTMYSLDKTNNTASKVDSIPAGAATINWGGAGFPPELQNASLATSPTSVTSTTGGSTTTPTTSTSSSGTSSPTTSGGTNPAQSSTSPYGTTSRNQGLEQEARSELGTTQAPGEFQAAANSGIINPGYINSVLNDPGKVAFYVNALAYGGYTLGDVLNDLKRGEMASNGDKTAQGMVLIDPEQTRSQYGNTAQGSAAYTQAQTYIPTSSLTGQLDPNILKYGANIPPQLFQQLVPIMDPSSKAFQDAVSQVQHQFYDLTSAQLNATTAQDKAIADNNYNTWVKNISQQYGIVLSNNATQAWQQINSMNEAYGQRGIEGSGIEQGDQDVYMRNVRSMNTNIRSAEGNVKLAEQVATLQSSGSPEDIKQFLATNPQYASQFGPGQGSSIAQQYNVPTLAKQLFDNAAASGYPVSMDDATKRAQMLHDTILDANGNFLSAQQKNNNTQQYNLIYGSATPAGAQLPTARAQVLNNAQNAESSAYQTYDNSNPYSQATTQQQTQMKSDAGMTNPNPTTSANSGQNSSVSNPSMLNPLYDPNTNTIRPPTTQSNQTVQTPPINTGAASTAAANISTSLKTPPAPITPTSPSTTQIPANTTYNSSNASSTPPAPKITTPITAGSINSSGQYVPGASASNPVATTQYSAPAGPSQVPNLASTVKTNTPPTPTATPKYTGTSIVDYLNSTGKASDYASRSALAAKNGITGYTGSAQQNTQLLGILNK